MNNIVGHEEVIDSLKNIVKTNSISNAYLFCGIEGIGKSIVATEFAKAILCLSNNNGSYCDECESCKAFNSSSDFIILNSENGSIKVESIRNLCKEIMLMPTISNRRVFIINDADTMNDSAQNALLKSLEEPPKYATIILIASNKSKLRKTILSRCVTINFNKLSKDELLKIAAKQGINLNDFALDYCGGSFGNAVQLANCDYSKDLEDFESAINSGNLIVMNNSLTNLKKIKTIKEDINYILNLLIKKLSSNLGDNPDLRVRQISIIEEVRENLSRSVNFDDSLDYLIIRLWEESNRRN